MEEKKLKLTFQSKKELVCPLCEKAFRKEDILSGGGRMNAGNLTVELHRVYLPTKKYGEVYPLLYPIVVCPACYYAALPGDFSNVSGARLKKLKEGETSRKESVKKLFSQLDFEAPRRLEEGVASYTLAGICYDSAPPEMVPTFKLGLCCLRAAWLCNYLHKRDKQENYNYLARIFYRKASFFYGRVIEIEQDGVEPFANVGHMGPDIDQNYGFDGVIYLTSYLEYRYGQRSNPELRIKHLIERRSTIARVVGMGKSSRAKPTAILEFARDLHKKIKDELDELGAEG